MSSSKSLISLKLVHPPSSLSPPEIEYEHYLPSQSSGVVFRNTCGTLGYNLYNTLLILLTYEISINVTGYGGLTMEVKLQLGSAPCSLRYEPGLGAYIKRKQQFS